MHRGALAAANRARRRSCRPRGRRRCNSSSRLRLVELVGWLDAQGYGGAGACFAAMAWALVRRQKLDGAAAAVTGKQRRKENEERRRWLAYNATKEAQRSHAEAFAVPTQRPDGHARDWKLTEARQRCITSGEHCSSKL